jgi:hypothetical protein
VSVSPRKNRISGPQKKAKKDLCNDTATPYLYRMQKSNQTFLAAAAIRELKIDPDLPSSEIALDRLMDRAIAWIDLWLATPFLDAGQSPADF